MRKPNNTILSMMRLYPELVLVKILRSNEAICRRLPTPRTDHLQTGLTLAMLPTRDGRPALVEISF
jgi:hypothetical protein